MPLNIITPSSAFLLIIQRRYFLWILVVIFNVCLYKTVFLFLSALINPAGKVLTSWPSCVFFFFIFPYGVSGKVWFLILSIHDLWLLLYFCFVDVLMEQETTFMQLFETCFFDELTNVLFESKTKSDCCCSISSHQISSPWATGVDKFAHCLWEMKKILTYPFLVKS